MRNLRKYKNLHDDLYAQHKFGAAAGMGPLVLPYVDGETRRIIYTITEYSPLLDSSNMSISDWKRIASDIQESYEFYDGFLILHGTDTLSYTASALSFMLENLGKTVIITGSQIPIFETRTDGKDNLTAALIIAGNYVIPEVCVMFGSKLMRGNRTSKMNCNRMDAFESPNVPAIANIGINIEIDYRLIFRPCTVAKFSVCTTLSEHVGLLRIFPSITTATVRAFLQPPMQGVVLQTFGAGNIPSNRQDLIDELKAAALRGVLIVNCTQCTTGSVAEIYATGQVLKDCGVTCGYDMTPEAALSKLAYVLGKSEWPLEMKRRKMESNIRGEVTSGKAPEMQDYDLVDAVARSLHLSTPQELHQLGDILFPGMVNSAVLAGDIGKLDVLKGYGANMSATNYDHRTALHIACCEQNVDVVRHLLLSGVSVHIRDRYDRSPLMEAIAVDNHEIISLLIKCGAHLTGSARAIGENLCALAARGALDRLESYRLAGADLSQPDANGRTALHVACLHGNVLMVKELLRNYVEVSDLDLLGLTAMDYAQRAASNREAILDMLTEAERGNRPT